MAALLHQLFLLCLVLWWKLRCEPPYLLAHRAELSLLLLQLLPLRRWQRCKAATDRVEVPQNR